MNKLYPLAIFAALTAAGCIQLKTESEIKPIHITMDVNLKVDKELDKAFKDEDQKKPNGAFREIQSILNRKAAGISNLATLVPRDGATDDDRITLAENNALRLKRLESIAKTSGVSLEAVQKRRAKQWVEKIPAGSGVWYQDADGSWRQK